MTSFSKALSLLITVLILTACGGSDTTTGDTTGNEPGGIIINPPPIPDTNHAPVISGTPATSVDEGSAYQFMPSASDVDGDSLTFSVENLPAWAVFDPSTGSLSGTPDYDAAGVYSNVILHVSDGELIATLPAFDIAVNNVASNDPPPDERAPVLLSVTVSGTDIVLTWTQAGLTPDGGYDVFIDGIDTGTQYRTTSLTTSIGGLNLEARHCFNVESRYTSTSSFYPSNQLCSVAQQPANRAPTISGTPPTTVVAGDRYTFTPSASDPDNDSLSFSVSNLPSWASFSTQTGAISGSPTESQVGVYADITISVSDGTETVSLAPFSVEVETAQAATGSLTISWNAPTTRMDGSPLSLSEIDGYCIFLGDSPSNLTMRVDLNEGSVTSHTLNNLPVGSYFVAVSVYDTDGQASEYSNTVEMTVTN
jgi:hypothetical protein